MKFYKKQDEIGYTKLRLDGDYELSAVTETKPTETLAQLIDLVADAQDSADLLANVITDDRLGAGEGISGEELEAVRAYLDSLDALMGQVGFTLADMMKETAA